MPIIKKIRPDILLVLLVFVISTNASAQDHTDSESTLNFLDTIVAKTNKIIIEEDTLPVYSISVGKVGTTFPCGNRFGISLQAPGYHIFSAESAFNATYAPNGEDIDWPDDEGSEKNNEVYQNTFNRIKKMRVGKVDGSFGKRWTISAEEFNANYDNLFDFELDGKMRKAGDYSNMFFEMLISIQQLAIENEDLKNELQNTESRLAAIEAKLNITESTSFIEPSLDNQLKLSPNPSNNGMLNIEYSINHTVVNSALYIFDLNGRTLYKTPIMNRGTGSITQSYDLSAGVYFYQLITDGNEGETEKLIVN